jgi:non-heme chloroperoxidase
MKHLDVPNKISFSLSQDFQIAAEAWGNPDHPPVLMLHGIGQSKQSWGDTASKIAQNGWYAIALDARGHGDSSWDKNGNYKMADNVADLQAVINILDTRPAIVGASMGGMTAMLAEGYASKSICKALILVDIVPRPDPKGVARIFAFMSAYLDGFESLEKAAKAVGQYMPHRSLAEVEKSLARNLKQRSDQRWYWHWDPAILNNFKVDTTDNQQDRAEKLLQAARNLTVPTLVVRGGMSDVVSAEAMQELLSVAPQLESVDVAEAHHMVAGDSNEAFSEAVIQFLRKNY